MYINFWYPICKADELTNTAPLRVDLLGLPFVAFRDSGGAAHVLADTCAHRGGSLSKGKMQGDCIACPYHGWRFDGDGRCVLIPSLGDKTPPARAKVDSYPVQEKYGVVFAFLGNLPEAERPPVCPVPEYGQDGWRASDITVLNINCYYERSMENGLDPVHNEFVHPGQGFPPMLTETFKAIENPWGSGFEAYFGSLKLEMTTLARERTRPGELRAGSWFHGPNGLVTSIFINADSNLVQYFFEAPVDSNRTRIYFLNMRNCMLEEKMDKTVMDINLKIAHEDIAILEELNPIRTPPTLTREIMTPGDHTVIRFRERLREWDARGWRINRQALKSAEGDVAYAIPCPARRESGNWVLEPVPLMQP